MEAIYINWSYKCSTCAKFQCIWRFSMSISCLLFLSCSCYSVFCVQSMRNYKNSLQIMCSGKSNGQISLILRLLLKRRRQAFFSCVFFSIMVLLLHVLYWIFTLSLKVGFFSGRKRESIFKSPEDPFGKVGVTGSGKGLTEFQKREKHLHLKGANMESADD